MEKTVGIIIKIALLVAIFVLAYFIVVGIQKPIKFEEQRNRRTNLTIDRLKDIRTAQIAYKNIYGRFTPSFDTLIRFIKTENLRVVRAIGFVPDSLTEAQAIKLKLVSRDTFFVPIIDSLFKHINYPIDSIRFSPTGKRIEFKMDTASVMTGSNVEVKVFQCYVLNFDVFDGLDNQYIINYNSIRKDTCLRVGSLTEANNNAGNWE